ncbi:MAG: MFS transporter [Anaerolineales bacterium]|nr:MFS transporter [Anaerolineales bacterium]
MSTLETAVQKHLRYNLVVNLIDGAFFGFGWGFGSMTTILPLFLSRMTDSALMIGLIPAIHGVAWQLPQLFLANRLARLRLYKPMVMLFTLHERIPYLGLALVALAMPSLGARFTLVLTFLLILWQSIGSGLTANPWQSMIAKIIPSNWRGAFFGLQAALANGLIALTSLVAGFLLNRLDDRFDFALCFLLAAVGMGLSMFFLGLTREPVDEEKSIPDRQAFPWREWLTILRRDKNFSAFLLVRFLSGFASMGFNFYILYGLRRFGMDEETAGALTAVLTMTQVLANASMGWLGDRFGHRAMLVAGSLAVTFSSLLAWGGPTLVWLYPSFVFAGLANVAYWTIGMVFTTYFGTEETRPTYIGLSNTLVAPATLIAPLVGGWLTDAVGFQATFLASAIGGLVIALILIVLVRSPHRQS